MIDIYVVFVTFPDFQAAETAAELAVSSSAAACVNIVQGVHSVYRWEGKIEKSSESLAIFKTTADKLDTLEKVIASVHSYNTFEFVAISADKVNEPYLRWVRDCCA